MKRKITGKTILVLGFYLLCALYASGSAHAGARAGSQPASLAADLQAFVVDHPQFRPPSQGMDDDSTPDSSSRFFINGKLLLARTRDAIVKMSLSAVTLNLPTAPGAAGISPSVPGDIPLCSNGFRLHHSGVSPPTA
jgi:hypothetical protein